MTYEAKAYLVISIPDYEGFTVVEAHLDEDSATARVQAANEYADSAPAFPADDADGAAFEAFVAAEEKWRQEHPLGPEVACGYLEQRYEVLPVPLGRRAHEQ